LSNYRTVTLAAENITCCDVTDTWADCDANDDTTSAELDDPPSDKRCPKKRQFSDCIAYSEGKLLQHAIGSYVNVTN